MLGAIIGDTTGSRFEFCNERIRGDFELLPFGDCFPTDDSIMTMALAEAILQWDKEGRTSYERLSALAVSCMRKWGRLYPCAGYGSNFEDWLFDESMGPYNSCGNGAAMRVSPVGWAANSLEECIAMSRAVTEVTHNHPDGIRGAEATAVQVYLARKGMSLSELKKYEEEHYYKIDHDIAYLKENYEWCAVCDGTCQTAYECVYSAKSFEEAIRNCIWSGGDCDTTAAIAGPIAEIIFGIPAEISDRIAKILDNRQKEIINAFRTRFGGNTSLKM